MAVSVIHSSLQKIMLDAISTPALCADAAYVAVLLRHIANVIIGSALRYNIPDTTRRTSAHILPLSQAMWKYPVPRSGVSRRSDTTVQHSFYTLGLAGLPTFRGE